MLAMFEAKRGRWVYERSRLKIKKIKTRLRRVLGL
jgi:hypothetical protein